MTTPPILRPVRAVQAEIKPQPEVDAQKSLRLQVQEISRRLSKWPDRPPSPEALMGTIKSLSEARKVSFLDHGDVRFQERCTDQGFDVFDVYEVLETGVIVGEIEPGAKDGEWKVKMVAVPDGTDRRLGVVPIVVQEKRLLIKTVEWEDR